MPSLYNWLSRVLGFWREKRDEGLRWQLTRQPDIAALRQAQVLAEQVLVAQLKKRTQQLAHELAISQTKNQNELAMVKTQCKQDLKDYQQYLQSLDGLKDSLRSSYVHLPEAVAFTIHHHAKQLLNSMWETQDAQERVKIEMQLIQFMTAVHEDSQFSLQQTGSAGMPQKTLAFIDTDR
ncbi:hypothetical protein A1359_15510 [Methylomonas lenta]|uniref:Uncharacterized protein n=1 Tax=Methylomonas lenta TaxID=980561 RepID=A0A177N193_9GAMM|nr:hypothetical protein [Methylomonas lenta]OAI10929.1 hypothetical protein A1359_15510 [Methylomonas lenta]